MRVVSRYSHLNGEEALRFRHGELWDEIIEVIESVDAESCRTKVSRERTRAGRKLYSPIDMNKAFEGELSNREDGNRGDSISGRPQMRGLFAGSWVFQPRCKKRELKNQDMRRFLPTIRISSRIE